jgi:hypothetical protein
VNAEYETLGQPSVTLDDIRRFRQLDSKAPVIPSITGYRASKRRPVLWDKVSPPASAWRSRRSFLPDVTTSRASRSSTTTFMPSVVTAA